MIYGTPEQWTSAAVLLGTVWAARVLVGRLIRSRIARRREAAGLPPEPLERSAFALGAQNSSEEERMRRFLEALGLPTESAAPQRRPAPETLRPVEPPKKAPTIPPVPPFPARPYETRRPQRPTPPAQTVRRPTPPPIPYEQRQLDSAPAPTTPAGRIRLPDLEVTKVEDFRTVSSEVSAVPSAQVYKERAWHDDVDWDEDQSRPQRKELWRAALASPEALRSAFILKEILGPPRSLQSSGGAHTFPSL